MKTTILAAMLMVMVMGMRAGAEVVFSDGIEDSNAVLFPGAADDADPNATVGGWSINENPETGGQVIMNAAPGSFDAGTKYLRVERWNWQAPGGVTGVGCVLSRTIATTETLYITFGYYSEQGQVGFHVVSPDQQRYVVDMTLGSDGRIRNRNVGVLEETGLQFSFGEWHEIRLVVKFATKKYDLYLDGQAALNLTFQFPFLPAYGTSDVGFSSHVEILPNIYYIDDVLIEAGSAECTTIMTGDFNGDCLVNLADFARFAAAWLECGLEPADGCSM